MVSLKDWAFLKLVQDIKYISLVGILLFSLLITPSWAGLSWLRVKNLSVVDEYNHAFILNGINLSNNVWGNWVSGKSESLEAQGKDPLVRPIQQDGWVLNEADFERLSKLKPKVVRYSINYELFAEENEFRKSNMDLLKKHIKRFDELGVYAIVNLHLPPGLDVQSDNFERNKPAKTRLQSLFENDEFWQRTVKMWQYLAANLKDLPAVAGYSVYNEPRLPSEADGGIAHYQKRQNELVAAIRCIDKKHIVFIPEYNSREDNDEKQSVIWERGFIKVSDANVVYVFSFYEPYEYTHLGRPGFNERQLDEYIQNKVNWAKSKGQAPILICEYGVNRNQPVDKRLKYIKFIDGISKKYDLAAIYWEYKSSVNPFTKPLWICGLFSEFLNTDKAIIFENGYYKYQDWAEKPAKENSFDALFRKYYYKTASSVSLIDNQTIWQSLHDSYK